MIIRKIKNLIRLTKLNLNKTCKFKSLIPKNTEYEEYVHIAKHCDIHYIEKIGRGTFINDYTRVHFTRRIGRYCSISHNVKIGMGEHPLDRVSTSPLLYDKKRGLIERDYYNQSDKLVDIGNDVLISANAIILKGVKIGDGAVVAAGSVVIDDIPPYAIVAGVPAKVKKYRFEKNEISKLQEMKWWNMDIGSIKKNISKFHNVKDFL